MVLGIIWWYVGYDCIYAFLASNPAYSMITFKWWKFLTVALDENKAHAHLLINQIAKPFITIIKNTIIVMIWFPINCTLYSFLFFVFYLIITRNFSPCKPLPNYHWTIYFWIQIIPKLRYYVTHWGHMFASDIY